MTTLVKTIYGIPYKEKNLLNYVLECFGKFKLENWEWPGVTTKKFKNVYLLILMDLQNWRNGQSWPKVRSFQKI